MRKTGGLELASTITLVLRAKRLTKCVGSRPVAVTQTSDFAPVSSKKFLEIQPTVECGFTLKRVHDRIRTYSQMHRTDKYS